MRELLQAIHGTAHRHPGFSKMLQGIRQQYYYPGIAKHVKKWVEGCEICAKDKHVPKNAITPELLNLPEWDLGPEDAMQIDLLPNLPWRLASGRYQTVMTAIDFSSRYLFAYPLIEATALNVAKVIIDIMTKHSYLPTTVITGKGSAFTSTILAEITKILCITLRCATTKHPKTMCKPYHQEDPQGPSSLLDERAFLHLLVEKEGEPSYVPLSTNLGLKFKRRMLYVFPNGFQFQ